MSGPGTGDWVVGGGDVAGRVVQHRLDPGNWRPGMPAMTPSCSRTCAGPGWTKMVRMVAATISAGPAGT